MMTAATPADWRFFEEAMQQVLEADPALHHQLLHGPDDPDPALIGTLTRRTRERLEALTDPASQASVARLNTDFTLLGIGHLVAEIERERPGLSTEETVDAVLAHMEQGLP